MSDRLADVGEFGLLARMLPGFRQTDRVVLGPGDDAAVLATPDGRVVAATDILVEGSHFRRDWSEPEDVGRKAAAQNFADIEAMGAVPTALLVGLSAPADLSIDWAMRLGNGLRTECEAVGAAVIGGDTVKGNLIVVAVTALGDLEGRSPLTRSGARPGDVVAVRGRLGWSQAGFEVLLRGFRSPRAVVAAHRCPEPPYGSGVEAARLGATALIDVSDGLVQDLGHIAESSQVAIDIDPTSLQIVRPLQEVGQALGADPLDWVLSGGEDHALVGCFPGDVALPPEWQVIGRVGAGKGVTVAGQPYDHPGGHDHFAATDS